MNAPHSPPIVDEVSENRNAFPGMPFLAMTLPSKIVAAAAGVPGMASVIAEIEPPYSAPC